MMMTPNLIFPTQSSLLAPGWWTQLSTELHLLTHLKCNMPKSDHMIFSSFSKYVSSAVFPVLVNGNTIFSLSQDKKYSLVLDSTFRSSEIPSALHSKCIQNSITSYYLIIIFCVVYYNNFLVVLLAFICRLPPIDLFSAQEPEGSCYL